MSSRAADADERSAGLREDTVRTVRPHRATVRVVLADDQAIVRTGIATLLTGDAGCAGDAEHARCAGDAGCVGDAEHARCAGDAGCVGDAGDAGGCTEPPIEVVGEASDGSGIVSLVRSSRPAVVLMDVRMPGVGGLDATRALRADPLCQGVAVLMLTTFDTDEEVHGAIRAGADGYLLKDTEPARLRAAVRAAARGEPIFTPSVARQVMAQAAAVRAPARDPRLGQLSDRELEVLKAVADGEDNATVAKAMRLQPDTVRTYVSRILTKLDARSRAQLVAIAHRSGLPTTPARSIRARSTPPEKPPLRNHT